jgi:hypothetical protein
LSDERIILAHCIADTEFMRKMHDVGKPELFESQFAKTVAIWVWEFFEETGQKDAPGRLIMEIYHRRKAETKDEEELELVQEYLQALSADWERAEVQSMDWSVQQGVRYFKLRALNALREKLSRDLDLQDWEGAEDALANFKRVEVRQSERVAIAKDAAKIASAFKREDEIVFTFPGALGQVIGPNLVGEFAGFFAPMKRGKSYWLKYAAYAGMRQGVKSLTVNLEMTLPQVTRRDWLMVCGSPEEPGEIKIPMFTESGGIEWETRFMQGAPRTESAIERVHKSLKYTCRGGEMFSEIMPSGSTTVSDLRGLVRRYKREGVDLRMLVVDYADLLAAENSRLDGRAALDWVWRGLRGLAQEEKLCIFTASQTGRNTLGRDAKESDAAEDVRKLAHVTKAIMLNQSDIERKHGIMRVRCQMQREGGPGESEAVVLEQRGIGRCYLDSRLRHDVKHEIVGKWREDEE